MAERRREPLLGTHPLDLMLVVAAAALGLAWSIYAEDPAANEQLTQGLRVATLTCAAILIVRLISWAAVDVALVQGRRKEPSALLRLLVSFVLYAAGLMLLLKYGLDRDISKLLTTSAVFTAVAGFALQATLGNLFEGVALQLEQPFKIGDVVRIGDVEGEVEALTWRAVHIRTEGQSRVVIPNSRIGGDSVEVLAGDEGILTEHTVQLDVSPLAPPGRVIELIEDAIEPIGNIARRPVPDVFMTGMREQTNTRIFEVQYFPVEYLEYEETDAEILRRAWYALDRHGISCAPPSEGVNRPDFSREERMDLIRDVEGLDRLADDALGRMVDGARFLRFTDHEPIGVDDLEEATMFVILRGTVTHLLKDDPDFTTAFDDDALNLAAWTPHVLAKVSSELAVWTGPVADLLVRRAARKTVDLFRLYHLLAFEIDDADARRAFLTGQPEHRSRKLGPGDEFGLDWVVGGPPIDLDDYFAVTEVLLLAMPRHVVAPEIENSEAS